MIVALGCSPGLGFVHAGHALSFVFDIADLYKAEVSIPIAFAVAAKDVADIEAETRWAVRDHVRSTGFLETCVQDVKKLLAEDEEGVAYGPEAFDEDVVALWDGNGRTVAAGVSYDDHSPILEAGGSTSGYPESDDFADEGGA